LQLRGSEYRSREAEIMPGGSAQQPAKADAEGRSWNSREQLKLSRTAGRPDAKGRSQNYRELLE